LEQIQEIIDLIASKMQRANNKLVEVSDDLDDLDYSEEDGSLWK
jgi:hypothetical protein